MRNGGVLVGTCALVALDGGQLLQRFWPKAETVSQNNATSCATLNTMGRNSMTREEIAKHEGYIFFYQAVLDRQQCGLFSYLIGCASTCIDLQRCNTSDDYGNSDSSERITPLRKNG